MAIITNEEPRSFKATIQWLVNQVKLLMSSSGTVTSVSVVTANGVSGSVATSTTTPAITLSIGAITPTSVNGVTISGSATPTLAVTGTTTVSGANTGDQSLSGLVPYTGASGAVDLNAKALSNVLSYNKVAITAPATSATLQLADGSTLATVGAFATTISSTALTGVTLPTSGTLFSDKSGSITSASLAAAMTDESGNGALLFAGGNIGAATGTSLVTTGGVNNVYNLDAEISSAQILAGFTTAVEIVAAPGAGKRIVFTTLGMYYDYGGTAYTINGSTAIHIRYTSKTGTAINTSTFTTGFIDQTVDMIQDCTPGGLFATAASTVNNQNVVWCIATANPTLGNGTIHIRGEYKIITTGQ